MKYFTLSELTHSNTAISKNIDNTPSEEVKLNLEYLVNNVLDPLRELYGKPIRVSSGYRSIALNKAVKGAKNSLHTKGLAADITCGTVTENEKLFNLIKDNLKYDQLIDEYDFAWVHVSYSNIKNRMLILKVNK